MTVTVDVAALQVASRIASTIDPVFATVDAWRDALAARLTGDPEPLARELDPAVERLVHDDLAHPGGLITGAGFVAAPGYLADAPWHLAWWLGSAAALSLAGGTGFNAGTGVRRLIAVSDPDSEQFRDYTTLEWWRVPARTGTRHLTGPYVDYLCTDDYTVTITTPVTVGDELVGLVGVDLYVAKLEEELLPVLAESARACTLVNASGRIVLSTDPHRATGALLRLDGLPESLALLRGVEGTDAAGAAAPTVLPDGAVVVPCGDTSLALVL
ncbi:PDC sensor domain-containing protein [Agromyces silvae]|uniref:PDC sensor domain-containing protein n=1 Tax=Agromyces silvae TaxID=3388266 RepID=UPI00280B9826|nr:hypothetical protein [Agromyces protaetiae]